MELGHSMEDKQGIMEFVKALWDAAKWKQIIAMGLALVLMTVPQMLNSSFTDGTGVDITPEETTIFFNYHIAFVICCMMASYGMTALGSQQMSKLGISVLKEWAVRWILFVLLPVLFFVAIVHLFDNIGGDSPYITHLFGVRLFNLLACYTLPLFFFGTSFFFLISTFFKRLSFLFGALILLIALLILRTLQPEGGFSDEAMQSAAQPVIGFLVVVSVLMLALSYYIIWWKRKEQAATAP